MRGLRGNTQNTNILITQRKIKDKIFTTCTFSPLNKIIANTSVLPQTNFSNDFFVFHLLLFPRDESSGKDLIVCLTPVAF